MAQLGQPDLKEQLLDGHEIGGTEYRVHLDCYDQTPILTQSGPSNCPSMPSVNRPAQRTIAAVQESARGQNFPVSRVAQSVCY
jgi:hypothetical protein